MHLYSSFARLTISVYVLMFRKVELKILIDFLYQDAVSPSENDYALVHDALPAGKLHRIRSAFRKKEDGKGIFCKTISVFEFLIYI